MNRKSAQAGFTLIEIMIAMVILGILVAIALPTFSSQQVSARRADCKAALVGFAQAMEKNFSINYTHLEAAVSDADTGAPASTLYPSQCPGTGTAYYNLTIAAATANSYTLRATPVSTGSQADDGMLEINSLGQRLWDKNNDSDTADAGENNWER